MNKNIKIMGTIEDPVKIKNNLDMTASNQDGQNMKYVKRENEKEIHNFEEWQIPSINAKPIFEKKLSKRIRKPNPESDELIAINKKGEEIWRYNDRYCFWSFKEGEKAAQYLSCDEAILKTMNNDWEIKISFNHNFLKRFKEIAKSSSYFIITNKNSLGKEPFNDNEIKQIAGPYGPATKVETHATVAIRFKEFRTIISAISRILSCRIHKHSFSLVWHKNNPILMTDHVAPKCIKLNKN